MRKMEVYEQIDNRFSKLNNEIGKKLLLFKYIFVKNKERHLANKNNVQ